MLMPSPRVIHVLRQTILSTSRRNETKKKKNCKSERLLFPASPSSNVRHVSTTSVVHSRQASSFRIYAHSKTNMILTRRFVTVPTSPSLTTDTTPLLSLNILPSRNRPLSILSSSDRIFSHSASGILALLTTRYNQHNGFMASPFRFQGFKYNKFNAKVLSGVMFTKCAALIAAWISMVPTHQDSPTLNSKSKEIFRNALREGSLLELVLGGKRTIVRQSSRGISKYVSGATEKYIASVGTGAGIIRKVEVEDVLDEDVVSYVPRASTPSPSSSWSTAKPIQQDEIPLEASLAAAISAFQTTISSSISPVYPPYSSQTQYPLPPTPPPSPHSKTFSNESASTPNYEIAMMRYNLAVCFEHGHSGIPCDSSKAIELYRLAAEQGHLKAMYNLSSMLLHPVDGNTPPLPEASKEGFEWLRRAATEKEGYPPAKFFLGILLYRGEGVKRDPQQAVSLLHEIANVRASDLAVASSISLARHYLAIWSPHSSFARLPDSNLVTHLAFLATHATSSLLYNLGVAHEKENNSRLAIEAYKACIQHGGEHDQASKVHIDAYWNSGVIYVKGRNWSQACECFEMAGRMGDKRANGVVEQLRKRS